MEYELVDKAYKDVVDKKKLILMGKEGNLEFSLRSLPGQVFNMPYVCH